ncbi:MAG TPA: hydantoinase/oxoprolinase family protein, partial [Solirubrobacteraceae bacterium]|nr:hydantoinase/oxoprolinase family protein [Solirubrobacteraceae bacterium]
AAELELEHAVAADVGGTSFDTCLIDHGRAPVLYEGSVVGLPIQTPWIDVRSIGAGGGSIAYVDAGGLLRVGPRSAGADPGPACYGRGGTEPTVTDAAIVLGMLPSERISGGVHLHRELAEQALERLAEQLEFESATVAARGVIQIVAAQMGDAIRGVTVERGRDPREAALVAFGGAGPLFGTLLAGELGSTCVVVPAYAGNFSAWGLLRAELAQTASRTYLTRLNERGIDAARELARTLFAQLDQEGYGRNGAGATRRVQLDMRFVGQEHTLTVDASGDPHVLLADDVVVAERFLDEYERTFGSTIDEALEIVCVRAVLTVDEHAHGVAAPVFPSTPGAADDTVMAWSFAADRMLEFARTERSALAVGQRLHGPAIITEATTTTYLDAGHALEVHPTGSLIVTRTDRP